ncbi:ABC transporter ATP-binding protein [Falsiroseomonas sp.]|uniref:ABC transporter ATP-binding protein n=1 Tax=Falsiroseomonas sp. TaxID=2870721 RepID=UPI0027344E59|nr:ABC transporter ATP-binding protein [Falsiroseomonas sp.]MDP3416106.1 ABC transporter ATP-binding protein [Falsiroseomonas sp.]
MIHVRDLTVTFGQGTRSVRAARDVSFTVAKGESFGLVGESGSGKSTVLRVLAGLNPYWTGEATVGGVAVAGRDARLPRMVQMVFQDPYASLHPRHTVDRALSEPLEIQGIGDVGPRVERALTDVGLGPAFRFRYPNQLSGGQRQRVAIARALMLEPKVLLLDEPTSALDVSVQAEILNLLRRLRQAHGLTLLLVSHNLAVIAHMCDRLAVMNRGQVVEEMDVATLRRQEPREAYTRQLLLASRGYDREVAAGIVTYD